MHWIILNNSEGGIEGSKGRWFIDIKDPYIYCERGRKRRLTIISDLTHQCIVILNFIIGFKEENKLMSFCNREQLMLITGDLMMLISVLINDLN